MQSNEQQVERNNHFPLSAGYVPSHKVQEVVAFLFFRLRVGVVESKRERDSKRREGFCETLEHLPVPEGGLHDS